MIISDKLLNELVSLEQEIHSVAKSTNMTEIQLEGFLRNLERRRYNILNEIKLYNKTVFYENEKIKTISDKYTAEIIDNVIKIYIPEPMPSYKNVKTHTHKNILLNIAEKTKPFANMFDSEIFIYIKIFDNIQGWDIDNRFIKPITDALILSGVIQDDNINKVFYCVKR